jgi:hypothetical protein
MVIWLPGVFNYLMQHHAVLKGRYFHEQGDEELA